jgi:cell division protein FtsW (lipid II flippase)
MSAAPTTARKRTSNATNVQQAAISRAALVAAWVLLAVGIPLALLGQPVLGALALLASIAAAVAALDTATRIRWVTLAAAVVSILALVVANVILATPSA